MKKSHLQTSSSPSIFVVLLLLLLCSPCSSNLQRQRQRRRLLPRPSPPTNSMEEKTRLGSTPPSCYSKCNGCHPCMAVQVPTEPIRRHAPEFGRSSGTAAVQFLQPADEGRYGNYKPLGWKCRCNNRLFNP